MRRFMAVACVASIGLLSACSQKQPVERVPAESMFGEPPGGFTYQEVPGHELATIAEQIERAPGVIDFGARLLVDGQGVVQGIVQAVGQEVELAQDPDHFDGFIEGLETEAGTTARRENVEGVDVRVMDGGAEGPSLAVWQVPGTNVFLMVNAADDEIALRVATALIR